MSAGDKVSEMEYKLKMQVKNRPQLAHERAKKLPPLINP